jgi:putative membrane-bound dehydrogenase-like protein
MQLPPGFKATVFAAEPDVQNPIAMAWDGRGRLWVAENYTYAEGNKRFDLGLRDRILIFEDTDGDGRFDKRTVFTDEVQMLTSIEIGYGGVWVMSPPQLLFIPDANHDDKPDGAPEVLLDGFVTPADAHHTFANGLRFGPDGWLYGRCGASSIGDIGRPGTQPDARIPLRGTMWRYHPHSKAVEVLSSGTTNPWGHDWNEHGELFFINTVNGHLWHEFPGAHFTRPHTFDPNPHVYSLIDQHADHYHFDTAAGWQKSRDGAANDLGGGHAHVGMMIYLGDNWPAEYRGHLFTLNLHGRRLNQEILERSGSGYVGKHGQDFFVAGDPWFRGMDLSYGPDGGVFVLDWSDTGECHEYTGVHRTSGRIYKITCGDAKPSSIGDISTLSASDLVKLHTHPNEWFSRQARLELGARSRDRRGTEPAREQLRALFDTDKDIVIKLRALWTLHVIGGDDEEFLHRQLQNPNEHVRAWAIRFLSDDWPLDTVMSERPRDRNAAISPQFINSHPGTERAALPLFTELAASDLSGLVRLTLASTLQRISNFSDRGQLATALLGHTEDANDHNLPLLIWYGLIPLGKSPGMLVPLAERSELPLTRKFIARALAETLANGDARPLDSLLKAAAEKNASFQTDVLTGMSEGLAGLHKARKPDSWDAFATKTTDRSDLQSRVRDLSVLFGDGRALDEVKKVALDKNGDLETRKVALATLIDNGTPDLRGICEKLLSEQFLNVVAVRGLASFNDPDVPVKIVKAYRQFHASERSIVISWLVSRASFASVLLDAIGQQKIPRTELSVFHARQIRGFNNPELDNKLEKVWGELRDSSSDQRESIARWKTKLTPDALAKADLSHGRALFNLACGACHTLYGEGGKVGPDLTGGGRENLDYLLENIVDPSAVVSADFRMLSIDLKDGRALNAIVASSTERTITVKTMTETLTLDRGDVAKIHESPLSLMPEGLLDALQPEQARDLIAYLSHRTQVPLPTADKN